MVYISILAFSRVQLNHMSFNPQHSFSPGMKIPLLVILLILLVSTQNTQSNAFGQSLTNMLAQNQCSLPQKPQKLAITTVTKFRAKTDQDLPTAITFFKTFLNRYAEMDCNVFDSIYLFWNNDKPPHEYQGLFQRQKYWKKNVYFLHTTYNALDHRWALPPWAPEQAFLSLDDDADIDCSNMQKGFQQWQDNVIGGIGPMAAASGSGRVYNYDMNSDQFNYQFQPKSYMSLSLPNIAIIPRHFCDLYYANLPEFEKMREIVIKQINSDDICLNFMIGWVYPQIRPIMLKGMNVNLLSSQVQLNKSPQHYTNRTEALNKYAQILGQNTLTYTMVNQNQSLQQIKADPLRNNQCLLALKKSIVEQKYLSYDHYYTYIRGVYFQNSTQLSPQLLDKIMQDQYIFSLPLETRKAKNQTKEIDLSYKSKGAFSLGTVKVNAQTLSSEDKKSQRLIKEIEELQNQNDLLKKFLILAVVGLVAFGFVLAFQCIRRLRKQKKSLQLSDGFSSITSTDQPNYQMPSRKVAHIP